MWVSVCGPLPCDVSLQRGHLSVRVLLRLGVLDGESVDAACMRQAMVADDIVVEVGHIALHGRLDLISSVEGQEAQVTLQDARARNVGHTCTSTSSTQEAVSSAHSALSTSCGVLAVCCPTSLGHLASRGLEAGSILEVVTVCIGRVGEVRIEALLDVLDGAMRQRQRIDGVLRHTRVTTVASALHLPCTYIYTHTRASGEVVCSLHVSCCMPLWVCGVADR